MNIQQYETKNGKKGYILKGAYIGIDVVTGKQVRTDIRGKTKTEVKREFELKKREFENNDFTVKKRSPIKTFDDLADAWLITYQPTIRASTYQNTDRMFKGYIKPVFGNIKLDKLTKSFMQVEMNAFVSGVSSKRKDYHLMVGLIKKILQYGVSLDLLRSNPMDNILINKPVASNVNNNERSVKFYNKEQFHQILTSLSKLEGLRYATFSTYIKLMLYTGTRPAEALVLTWEDVDFNKKTLRINKTLSNRKEILAPKNGTSRVIDLDDNTLSILRAWRKVILTKCLELGLKEPSFIFYSFISKSHYQYNNMWTLYKDFCKVNDIEYMGGLHCFRHTHATMYLNNIYNKQDVTMGDYKYIQTRLGHKKIAMTMDVYSHLFPETNRTALDNMISYMNSK